MARGKKTKKTLQIHIQNLKGKSEPIRKEGKKSLQDKHVPRNNPNFKIDEGQEGKLLSGNTNAYFKSEEIQEICSILNIEQFGDPHFFLGAVLVGKYDVVKKLLKNNYCIDSLDESKQSALLYAVKHFRVDMVDFLISRGADISVPDQKGNTALLSAALCELWDEDCFCGLWQSVQDDPRLQPDHANKAGCTLLHLVTRRRWAWALEAVLPRALSTLDCCTEAGETPLIVAAARGDVVSVDVLLRAGADVFVEDQHKSTAICYAIASSMHRDEREQTDEAVKLLLAVVSQDQSNLSLEKYLKRRLELLVRPPVSKAGYIETIDTVVVHVLKFFAGTFITGMDILLRLNVFARLKESIERHLDDESYVSAVQRVVMTLRPHSRPDVCALAADLGLRRRVSEESVASIKLKTVSCENELSITNPSEEIFKETFAVGYQLFEVSDDSTYSVSSDSDCSVPNITNDSCLESRAETERRKVVSDEEVRSTMKCLGDLFASIVKRLDLTWKKGFDERGLKNIKDGKFREYLFRFKAIEMLENVYIYNLSHKWINFCCYVKNIAKHNHVLYGAMVSDLQAFLLELEADLDKAQNIVNYDNYNLISDSYLDTQHVLTNIRSTNTDTLTNGEPLESLINQNSLAKDIIVETTESINTNDNEQTIGHQDFGKVYDHDEIYMSDSEESDLTNIDMHSDNEESVKQQPLKNLHTTIRSMFVKPPPGFEKEFKWFNTIEEESYCGDKYVQHSLALANLPACQTEVLEDGLMIVTMEVYDTFKLFSGHNFGDIELGLNSSGIPLAVRRLQKKSTWTSTSIRIKSYKLIQDMVELRHKHVLPYFGCHETPLYTIISTPLCCTDLGQHLRQLHASGAHVTEHLTELARQLMAGLHFLHVREEPIIHGNLKPSNVLVDAQGCLRVAEFGLNSVLYQQQQPLLGSKIWWAQETLTCFYDTGKYECTMKSDVQAAGMLLHSVLTLGGHSHGCNLLDIEPNIVDGRVLPRITDPLALDLLYWMVSHEPDRRPNMTDVLRHILFWDDEKKWNFLLTCSGLNTKTVVSLPFDKFCDDIDNVGNYNDINDEWISIMKANFAQVEDGSGDVTLSTPGGWLRFLNKHITSESWPKEFFITFLPFIPLYLIRLLETTPWMDHPLFRPFTELNLFPISNTPT